MTIRSSAEKAAGEVLASLAASASDDQARQAVQTIEHAIIEAVLEEHERCVSVARKCCEADTDRAHKITQEITLHTAALIANLSGMR